MLYAEIVLPLSTLPELMKDQDSGKASQVWRPMDDDSNADKEIVSTEAIHTSS